MKPAAVLALVLLGALGGTACASGPSAAPWLDGMPEAEVTVESGGKRHVFNVWVAATPSSTTRGLMFVRSLEPDRGMIFLFDEPHYASFWMRNTYVSLDMFFVDEDGRIVNIAERTTPLTITPIVSDAPVTTVLELVAGTAARLGIRAGDRVGMSAPAAAD